jgi:ATP-dependent exoDNAse (exonuclease V) beta subunit
MSKSADQSPPSDLLERQLAFDPSQSILVQAPAGSGKTDLLTRRFLRLLVEVEEPGQVVAITFTNAAAAEMRHRILAELEKAADNPAPEADTFSMDALAYRALMHSRALGWKLLDLPAQLRISTIDSFCREMALQQPLLSSFGGGLKIAGQPEELYRRATRETLRKVDQAGSAQAAAIEELLMWRDNGWQEMEELLVEMLKSRDRWMHGFVFESEPDWAALRERLERPFANAVRDKLIELSQLLDCLPGVREQALELARFACEQSDGQLHQELAELVEFPSAPFAASADLEGARQAHVNLATLLLTGDGAFRKLVDKRLGFPANRKQEKGHILDLIAAMAAVPGLEAALAELRNLPPARYAEEDWQIVRSCFTLLRQAAGELQIAFAEAGEVDFIEVAQIAQRVLRGEDGRPTDAALAVADGIHHLLVDEFQDTSRRQHQLLSSLIAAWPERPGRTCFAVGDPMQSIYFFRDADAELFPRVKELGLEIPYDEPLLFNFVALKSNFRTAPPLVERLNQAFARVFAADDGSGVTFFSSLPARKETANAAPPFSLHLNFVPLTGGGKSAELGRGERERAQKEQIDEIVALIRSHQGSMEKLRQDRERGEDRKFRIAVLGRARNHLVPIAAALREAKIPFRAVELEKLAERPEVLDAFALARALFNPEDRVAWLGVLRAPWCGLSLDDLHRLAGEPELFTRPVPELLAGRLPLLSEAGRPAAARVLEALAAASSLRATQPTASLGSWLEQVWLLLGGAACVDSTARANLNLLWSCLDRLPGGEVELLGSGLDAALDKLTALPDPNASSDCGVQLMTIHKSKGLEFEIVIVPELQAGGGRNGRKMLSWLERGLAQPGESGEITEFLIAPFQRKGEDRRSAKAWVDRVYRERELQENRRILYVAATRAREQLHLFARPACKEEGGSFTLLETTNSLLATAWPALEEEIQARFEDWQAARTASQSSQSQEIESIAASGENNLLVMPSPTHPTLLRRLPPDHSKLAPAEAATLRVSSFPVILSEAQWLPRGKREENDDPIAISSSGSRASSLYTRHEGGLLSRALGTAVHTLLEELAWLRKNLDWPAARSALQNLAPRIAAQVRSVGVDQLKAAQMAAQALELALNASQGPVGAWILSPHPSAASETAWAGSVDGSLRTVRPDRVFQAGPAPCSEGDSCWWIIDYKTAYAENIDSAKALPELRALFAPQIEAYAQILSKLHGKEMPDRMIRVGLYYPRILLLDWWKI